MNYIGAFRPIAIESPFSQHAVQHETLFLLMRRAVQFRGRGTGLANQTGRATENIPLEEEMPASSLSYS